MLTTRRTRSARWWRGEAPGRRDDEQVTLFKSVGNAVQDLAVAIVVLEEAKRLKLGTEVRL